MKKVLHLIREYKGNYPLLNNYVKALPADQYQSIVCYLSGKPDGKNELETIASDVRYLEYGKRALRRINLKVIYALYKLMREYKIDIVHCHRHKATMYGAITATIARVPSVISHVHGLARTRSIGRRITNWLIFKWITRVIAVSESVREDVIRSNWNIKPSKVVVVKNGIDLRSLDNTSICKRDARLRLGILEDKLVFCTVGRLVKTKGHLYLLEAFSRVHGHIPHSVLVIIGEGPLAKELQEKAEALNISQQVVFAGYRKDVFELLSGGDIFVLPSLAEGLSLALLEAMALKLPVIASKVGGIPEVLENGKYGVLVDAKDSLTLSTAMRQLGLLREAERVAASDLARRRVEDAFSSEIMQEELLRVYESITE